jgi:hypothetical protein
MHRSPLPSAPPHALHSRRRLLAGTGATVALLATSGCHPITIRTLRLTPVQTVTGTTGFAGSTGFCTSQGNLPPLAFGPRRSDIQVGFEHFFRAGTSPFPCDDIEAVVYRAGILFDLSAFDNVGLATLEFRALQTFTRSNGQTQSTLPPTTSAATMLAQATQPFTSALPADNDATLPPGPVVSVAVGGQVHDWTTGVRPNFGFVLWGPLPPVDRSNPPKDNNALVTRYGEFSLTLFYNPALNPRAPA